LVHAQRRQTVLLVIQQVLPGPNQQQVPDLAACLLIRLNQGTFGGIQGTFGGIQGIFGGIQGTFGGFQGTFGCIQGTFGGIQGTFDCPCKISSECLILPFAFSSA
jgi:hypothetical protein